MDFYCHSDQLVIEIDGEIHQQQIEYDLEREGILRGRGLSILRFSNGEVLEHLDRVLFEIARMTSPSSCLVALPGATHAEGTSACLHPLSCCSCMVG